MSEIEEFSSHELARVKETLFERYKRVVNVELADAELRLDPESSTLTECPTLFWRFGTGLDEYDDIGECVAALLRVQADHQRERAGVRSGATGADLH